MFVFELPEIGEGVIEGEVVRWMVSEGDVIAVDQPVCEIMTDKATVEISSPRGGQVTRLHAAEGDVVKVHSPLVDIATDGADSASSNGAAQSAPAAAPSVPSAPSVPAVAAAPASRPPPPRLAPPAAVAPPPTNGRSKATPAVRRSARELGVDIHAITGTGPGGRVTQHDLSRHSDAPAPSVPVAVPQAHAIPSGAEEHIKIIGLRRKIAEQMVKARFTAPHFTYVDEVDATELVRIRGQLKGRAAARGVKLSFLPFVMKALCVVFRDFPNANANVIEDPFTLVVKGDVNIGIATDTPRGLYVPVVKNVEQKSILQIAAELQDLVARTRDGSVQLDELQGGTFTITSVGNIGGLFATPIINHPEVAILGVNKIHPRPVVRDGEVVVRQMMYLSPSFDHRILDGAVAARFVTALKQVLEAPESLLLELA